jgi:hypothetical protein
VQCPDKAAFRREVIMVFDWPTVVNTFFGAVLGAILSIPIALHFYKKAGKGLHDEVEELRKLNKLTIHILGDAGLVNLNDLARDSSGKLTGGIKKVFSVGVLEVVEPTSAKE